MKEYKKLYAPEIKLYEQHYRSSAICRNEGVSYCMDKHKLNFRFHNPNSDEDFVRMLISVCMETCKKKADEAISAELLKNKEETAVTDADKKE